MPPAVPFRCERWRQVRVGGEEFPQPRRPSGPKASVPPKECPSVGTPVQVVMGDVTTLEGSGVGNAISTFQVSENYRVVPDVRKRRMGTYQAMPKLL